jgi:NAD(P)H-dependent flavin oxidoreductase YrpB (nitropropane dioxygenase family)
MLGADGVVVGTRLWASAEALTPQAHIEKALGVNPNFSTKKQKGCRFVA